MNISNELYRGLKRYRGSITEVSKRAGYTVDTTRLVLQGKWRNVRILEVAAEVLKERRQQESKRLEKVKQTHEEAMKIAV